MPVFTSLTACKHAAILFLLVTLLQACSTSVYQQQPGVSSSPLYRQAEIFETQGNFQGAAKIYLQLAERASGNEQHALQLKAADSLISAAKYRDARAILDALPLGILNLLNMQHYDVNRAVISLRENRPDTALAILQVVPLSGPFVADIHRLRAEAYLQTNQYFQSARERILLDPLLQENEKRLENEYLIWESLSKLTDIELQNYRSAPPPDPVSGWIELLELTRLYLQQPDAMKEVTPRWQQRYPGHPASLGFIDAILGSMRVAGQPPEQLALLLPQTGNFADAARAIRDGLFAAYYDAPESAVKPRLRLYDTGETPESALAAYQRAADEGAQFVIGPLRKEDVEAVARQQTLPVPVLALNHIQGPSYPGSAFYQFGLAPEDEAREVARTAWQKGHRRSLAIIPDNDWGERVSAAFADTWQSLGGEVLAIQRYDTSQTDHGDAINTALNLDASRERHRQISRLLGRKLEFEPRRRQDVDFVFLLASPLQARLIRPQLSFYHAASVPVYSTSQVFTGEPDKARDIDLNDLVFCDMPWILEHNSDWMHLQKAIDEYWPGNSSRYKRLYALGIDAYRIIPYITQLGGGMFGTYQGASGNLSIDDQGQVKRTLRCAQFRNGLPYLLEPVTREDYTTIIDTP